MMAVREQTTEIPQDAATAETSEVPAEVEFVLSAMEAGLQGTGDKRRAGRAPYRVRGLLRLFADPEGTDPVTIYTRDVCPRSLGFITRHRLPLGYGGVVELMGKDGETLKLDCTLLRCRESTGGWYEGAMYFNRQQGQFAAEGRATSKPRLVKSGAPLTENVDPGGPDHFAA
jgi:hypothetical protein